jgi:hypothetical protein
LLTGAGGEAGVAAKGGSGFEKIGFGGCGISLQGMVAREGVGDPGKKEARHERGVTIPRLGCGEVTLGHLGLAGLKGRTTGKEGELRAGGVMLYCEEVEGQEGGPLAKLPLHPGTAEQVVGGVEDARGSGAQLVEWSAGIQLGRRCGARHDGMGQ